MITEEKLECIKLLNNKRTTKEQFRVMLAKLIGYNLMTIDEIKQEEATLHNKCKSFFLMYCKQAKIIYSFSARDGKALNDLIKKLQTASNVNDADNIYNSFVYMIKNIPQWYKQNAFTLPAFAKNFNSIINQIRNSNEHKANTYRQQQIRDLYQQ